MAHAICFMCTFLFYVCHLHLFCFGFRDTLKQGEWIHDGIDDKIVSAGNIFQLGFFTLSGNSKGTYVGIWYYNSPEVIVWVAIREKPIPVRVFGTFGIDITSGNLKVSDRGYTTTYFSTNLTHSPKSGPYCTAKLHDSGNLVLTDDRTNTTLWESFEHPTDTFLLGMKMDENLNLTSWTSDNDPAPGRFSFLSDGLYTDKLKRYWKIEKESTNSFISTQMNIISAAVLYLSAGNTTSSSNIRKGISYCNHTSCSKVFDKYSRLLIRSDGKVQILRGDLNLMTWSVVSEEPQGPCSFNDVCGSSSRCKPDSDNYSCTCLPGYEPANEKDWKSGEFSGGCKKISSNCKRDNTTIFELLQVAMVRSNTPLFKRDISEDGCKSACQDDCTCQAYSYRSDNRDNGRNQDSSVCWYWLDDLIDIQEGLTDGNYSINFRHDPSSNIGI